jgi:hypothetical protein
MISTSLPVRRKTDKQGSERAPSISIDADKTLPARGRCVVCRAKLPEPFLDLGRTALANKFLLPEDITDVEPTFPLRVTRCAACAHIQLTELVPPALMFEDYLYVSSASDTLQAHLHDLADVVVQRRSLDQDDLVIDVGANDGTLLKGFRLHRVRTLGVDPALNLAEREADTGIDRYTGFFNARTARDIVSQWGRATVITATNTFPHIPNLHDFMTGIDIALAPGGAFVIEAHYLLDILDQLAFDTVYHEHVSYWALGPLQRLFAEHDMEVTSAERLPIHHGQLRVFVQRRGEREIEPSVARALDLERERRLYELETWQAFADRVMALKRDLHRTLSELRADGYRVAGYGAPAKGNTLLSFLELGPHDLAWIADRSPLKQGRVTPGSHIPVVAPDRLLSDRPDAVLLLAWNFAEEILSQQREYLDAGGRFILPVPEVRFLP